MPVSVKDVAARAGVSLGTVSNVLNRPEQVTPATRERVQTAIAELGFVRNESARQLRAGTSRTRAPSDGASARSAAGSIGALSSPSKTSAAARSPDRTAPSR